MSAKLAHRLAVVAILAATVAAALAAYFISGDIAQEQRDDRLAIAREATLDALAAREDFLGDVTALAQRDPAGVAAFARIQARDEGAVVSLSWVRPGASAALPLLPSSAAAGAGAAAGNSVARHTIDRAIAAGHPAISPPVKLPDGHPAFYLASPVGGGAAAGGGAV